MEELKLVLIENDAMYDMARDIVEKHHSYVPTFTSVGRRIDWLIQYNNAYVGMIGIGSSTYPPCKDILRYLNISKDEYKNQFNSFANNWRYCLVVKEKNLGTQILKLLRQEAPKIWWEKYNDELKYLITYVGDSHDGAMYKADNWELIGKTAGLPAHKSVSMKWDSADSIKTKFAKPTGENSKLIFIKKLKHSNFQKTIYEKSVLIQ